MVPPTTIPSRIARFGTLIAIRLCSSRCAGAQRIDAPARAIDRATASSLRARRSLAPSASCDAERHDRRNPGACAHVTDRTRRCAPPEILGQRRETAIGARTATRRAAHYIARERARVERAAQIIETEGGGRVAGHTCDRAGLRIARAIARVNRANSVDVVGLQCGRV